MIGAVWVTASLLLAFGAAWVTAQERPEQIQEGRSIYTRHCAPCHGSRMQDPQGAFNLRNFPRDQRVRFVNAVTRGKNSMPPWGDLLKPDDLDALWAYVVAGEAPEHP